MILNSDHLNLSKLWFVVGVMSPLTNALKKNLEIALPRREMSEGGLRCARLDVAAKLHLSISNAPSWTRDARCKTLWSLGLTWTARSPHSLIHSRHGFEHHIDMRYREL